MKQIVLRNACEAPPPHPPPVLLGGLLVYNDYGTGVRAIDLREGSLLYREERGQAALVSPRFLRAGERIFFQRTGQLVAVSLTHGVEMVEEPGRLVAASPAGRAVEIERPFASRVLYRWPEWTPIVEAKEGQDGALFAARRAELFAAATGQERGFQGVVPADESLLGWADGGCVTQPQGSSDLHVWLDGEPEEEARLIDVASLLEGTPLVDFAALRRRVAALWPASEPLWLDCLCREEPGLWCLVDRVAQVREAAWRDHGLGGQHPYTPILSVHFSPERATSAALRLSGERVAELSLAGLLELLKQVSFHLYLRRLGEGSQEEAVEALRAWCAAEIDLQIPGSSPLGRLAPLPLQRLLEELSLPLYQPVAVPVLFGEPAPRLPRSGPARGLRAAGLEPFASVCARVQASQEEGWVLVVEGAPVAAAFARQVVEAESRRRRREHMREVLDRPGAVGKVLQWSGDAKLTHERLRTQLNGIFAAERQWELSSSLVPAGTTDKQLRRLFRRYGHILGSSNELPHSSICRVPLVLQPVDS